MTDLEQLAFIVAEAQNVPFTGPKQRKIAQAILDAGWTRPPAVEPVTCAWCTNKARGSAWHNDGKLHPSCGHIYHGSGWVPPQPEAHNPARDN